MPMTVFGRVDRPGLRLPFFLSRISAGFPSPAEDHIEANLSLARLDEFSLTVIGSSPIDVRRRLLAERARALMADGLTLAGWIADPQAIKPGVFMPPSQDLDGETLRALATYLEHLK